MLQYSLHRDFDLLIAGTLSLFTCQRWREFVDPYATSIDQQTILSEISAQLDIELLLSVGRNKPHPLP